MRISSLQLDQIFQLRCYGADTQYRTSRPELAATESAHSIEAGTIRENKLNISQVSWPAPSVTHIFYYYQIYYYQIQISRIPLTSFIIMKVSIK